MSCMFALSSLIYSRLFFHLSVRFSCIDLSILVETRPQKAFPHLSAFMKAFTLDVIHVLCSTVCCFYAKQRMQFHPEDHKVSFIGFIRKDSEGKARISLLKVQPWQQFCVFKIEG